MRDKYHALKHTQVGRTNIISFKHNTKKSVVTQF